MVKGVSRSGTSSSQHATAQPHPLPAMQAGQNPHDPLTQLNSHMGYGAMAGLNPFADMGLNPNDPNMVRSMYYYKAADVDISHSSKGILWKTMVSVLSVSRKHGRTTKLVERPYGTYCQRFLVWAAGARSRS